MLVHGLGGAKEDFADHVPALARDHTVVIFDHRGHGASDNRPIPPRTPLDRMRADTLRRRRRGGTRPFPSVGSLDGGMVARGIAITETSRVDALVMMDTRPGRYPGSIPSLMDIGCDVALNEGKQALKELMDMASVLETPAYKRVLAARPGYPSSSSA